VDSAYKLGRISAKEATAVGCNWNFGPITDIAFNWRNTIINSRSFSNDPQKVLDCSRAYIKGIKESSMLSCAKHFPGDGVDERDQHLLMSVNDLSCEDWDSTYGMVYRGLIEDGLESIMVGHISLPAYEKKLNPQLKEEEMLPATLSPELVNGLLRTELGFQGLVITDASHMGGMLSAMPRKEQVPRAIAAGCDMFLFVHDAEEDIRYMKAGYENGIITEERLQEALMRILGMKAKLGLPQIDYMAFAADSHYEEIIGCQEHKEIARQIAEKTVTLVKDTANLLPISSERMKKARLYYIESTPQTYAKGTDPAKHIVKEELERAGFEVDLNESLYDLEFKEPSPLNLRRMMECLSFEEFKKEYDVVFIFIHMSGYAQENNVLPWWICDVPTIGVSLNFTNHLFDMPMIKTFVNSYVPTRECIRATVEKIVGKSTFTGVPNENVWCGRTDTKY
jgi:beta-N-acetylhexosaminidase